LAAPTVPSGVAASTALVRNSTCGAAGSGVTSSITDTAVATEIDFFGTKCAGHTNPPITAAATARLATAAAGRHDISLQVLLRLSN
jgi:hypothetical protein